MEASVGKAGFIYTIDATLALFLLLLASATVVFLSAQAEESPYVRLQMVRVGKDSLAILDRSGALSGGDAALIGRMLNETLPESLGANVKVYTYYKEADGFRLVSIREYGLEVPANTAIYGARRDFVSMKNGRITNYSVARMSIWQR
ncbi:MAG: hypothetical protein N3E51_02950 [Candidatus Micrarchaeota archaeon]|nr:hypothetical protein [Candidatus Micrarchaeota archaeon]